MITDIMGSQSWEESKDECENAHDSAGDSGWSRAWWTFGGLVDHGWKAEIRVLVDLEVAGYVFRVQPAFHCVDRLGERVPQSWKGGRF